MAAASSKERAHESMNSSRVWLPGVHAFEASSSAKAVKAKRLVAVASVSGSDSRFEELGVAATGVEPHDVVVVEGVELARVEGAGAELPSVVDTGDGQLMVVAAGEKPLISLTVA